MTEGVLPGLYLGNFIDAKDLDQLGRNKITHIISIHESPQPLLQDITYLRIPVADTPEVPIKKHFKECINFIHCCRLNGGNCLVHCFAGISRSTTIVTAYVMTVTGLGWRDVLEAIKATRPIANPNPGFRQQLEEFGWASSQKDGSGFATEDEDKEWPHRLAQQGSLLPPILLQALWLTTGARHRTSKTSGAQCPPMTSATCLLAARVALLSAALVREATGRTAQRCRLSPRAAAERLLGPPPHVAAGWSPDPKYQICLCFGEEDPGPTQHPKEQLIMADVQVQLRPGSSSCTLSASTERPDGSSTPGNPDGITHLQCSCLHPKRAASSSCTR
ncbi:dual specificity protein phosphatase 15 isoform X2 [Homo sapiens]|uniref:dual specificity protein phosphatase 15 isoform X2 n=1 Tax=Homo sapiens TaxID=9606 RepID=UPI0007DC6A08|nr:dual specificity protein phosphatase 15 isoform X2 [Homo sapiens]XP_054178945.1 dual specificity protein phosphatase 15 isoform X2 [Homo sapiens]|eukprot:XP_016883144.1 dual specificity protein phosphatase 15 isoform X2 [Homo sapiens]